MSFVSLIISFLIIAIPLALTVIPFIVGLAKKKNIIKPVEYFPPQGASPLDFLIEYYGASAQPHEVFNPLMLYWAERGFITIEEDCKRGLKLTKLKDLEPPENKDGFNAKTYKIEQKLFEELFGGTRTVFYTLTADSTFKDRFIKITDSCKKEAMRVTDYKSKKFRLASLITSYVMLFFINVFVGISIKNNVVIACLFPFIAILVPKALFSIPDENDGMPKGSAARFLLVPFFALFGGVPFLVVLALVPFEAVLILAVAMAVCILNVYLLSDKIDIRDNEQLKFYAKICGFKQFLLLAEVKQLEMMVEENPNYYYKILPYCYVLKITHKLKPKFDRIALDGPAWYLGELRETLML